MTSLEDGDARIRAVRDTDASLALSAGAGAGKTRVLVDRICQLLEASITPTHIAAVTFTEAAAGEARARVRAELERRIAGGGPSAEVLSSARDALGQMMATTVHAFALRLLENEAFEAGWSPGTRIAATELGLAPFDEARAIWQARLLIDRPDLARQIAGGSSWNLQKSLEGLAKYRDLSCLVADEGDLEVSPADFWSRVKELHAAARECGGDPETCKLMRATDELRTRFAEDVASDQRPDLDGVEVPSVGGLGAKSHWTPEAKDRMHRAVAALEEEVRRLRSTDLMRRHRDLAQHARSHFIEALLEAKRAQARADFDDILFEAASLLKSSPVARRRLHDKLRYILVDEVQDTDPLQAEIVALLTRAPQIEGPWDAAPVSRGRLFAVGDAKQSIYRFRRADHATWGRVRDLIAQDGERLELTTNFRSVPGIVGFVNDVFSDLPGYTPQVAHRSDAHLDPVVVLRTPETNGRGAAQEDDAHERDAIARYLRELLNDPLARVATPDGPRRPAFRDVLIVLPSWTNAEALQDALTNAGIPSFVGGGSTFFERDEVRLSLAALRALEEPGDAEAVVAVLRGLCGASFVDLARHAKSGAGWRYTADIPAGSPCRDGLWLLRRVRERRRDGSLADRLDELLEETGAPAVWSLQTRGEAIKANLEKLRQLIRELEQSLPSPGHVVAQLQRMARSRDGEEELPARPYEGNAVEITSVFKAKGREAPIVVAAHVHRALRVDDAIVDDGRESFRVRFDVFHPPGWDQAKSREQRERREELRRMVYVAATRARDQLVFCWHDGRQGAKTADLLAVDIGRRLPRLSGLQDEDTLELQGSKLRLRTLEALAPVEGRARTFGPHEPAVRRSLERAATGDLRADQEDAYRSRRKELVAAARGRATVWRSVKDVAEQRVRRRGSGLRTEAGTGAGAEVGTAVHRVLEAVDVQRPMEVVRMEAVAELDVQARLLELRPEAVGQAKALLEELLGHPIFETVRQAPEVWHETPFAHAMPHRRNQVVNGVIDLCFPTDESRSRWVIVDWKTDRPREGTLTLEVYREQLQAYAQGFLQTWLGHPVVVEQTVLVGPSGGVDPWEEALSLADPRLHELIEALRAGEAAVPVVGGELDAGQVIAELLWSDARVVVLEDPTEAARLEPGWKVFGFEVDAQTVLGALSSASPPPDSRPPD